MNFYTAKTHLYANQFASNIPFKNVSIFLLDDKTKIIINKFFAVKIETQVSKESLQKKKNTFWQLFIMFPLTITFDTFLCLLLLNNHQALLFFQ